MAAYKEKVGIITHFYQSVNYGGVLQAYALTKKLNSTGIDAEQICYPLRTKYLKRNKKSIKRVLIYFYTKLRRIIKVIFRRKETPAKNKILGKRELCFEAWGKKYVPQSSLVYDEKTINQANKMYDFFITGSDQVWNYEWYSKNLFLDFAKKNKKKIAYAASIGHEALDDYQKKVFKKHLKIFSAVSVRENSSVEMLKDISPVPVEHVCDPVFLLGKNEWEKVTSEPLVDEKYVFCYFLGNDNQIRDIATEYARGKILKTVEIDDIVVGESNCEFADIILNDVDPSGFLSLIKNAEYVITDSFHATAFSIIFEKEVFIFERAHAKGMSSRISSLASILDCEEHFCNTEEKRTVQYLKGLDPVNYGKGFEKLDIQIEKSKDFLKNALEI